MSKATDLVAVARDAGASGYVNVAGDAMTGSLTIDGTNNNFFFDSTLGAIRLRTNEGVEKATIRLDGNDMYVEVANLTRLRIDSAGRVTMPYQPSFDAYNFTPLNAAGDIVWTSVWHNTGGHFNTSNGVFTAPVAGLYSFNFSILMSAGTSVTYQRVLFKINGTVNTRFFDSLAGGVSGDEGAFEGWNYIALTGAKTIKLAANDTVRLSSEGSGTYPDGIYGHFAGSLIG